MRKGFFKKMAAVVLAVVTTMTMFTGCGGAHQLQQNLLQFREVIPKVT